MTNFQDLRNRFVLASISSSVVGLLLWITPNAFTKFLSPVIGFGGMGGVVVSQLITDETEKNWIKMNKSVKSDSDKLQTEIKQNKSQINADLIKYQAEANQNKIEIRSLTTINEAYQKQLAESRQVSDKQAKVSNMLLVLTAANFADLAESESNFNARLSKVLEVDADSSADLLQDSLNIFVNEINGLMSATRYHYPDLEDKVDDIAAKVADKVEEFTKLIEVVRTFTTCNELIGAVTSIQHQIIYHLSIVKGHLYQAQLREIKLDTLPISEHNKIVESVDSAWKQKYNILSGNIVSIRQEFSVVADDVINSYNSDYNEIINSGMSESEKASALELELHHIKQIVADLEKPLLFASGSPKSDNGNRIIAHYLKRKIKLDAFDWVETETGYTLYFYVGRNGNTFIGEEILNDENSGEKIRDLVSSLNIPAFKRSERGTHYTLEIQTRRPTKKESAKDDIDKIWITANKFETFVKRFERVRITAGSTGGKSPTAKNLALAIMKSRHGNGEIKLYDPVHGSKKDYWEMPKFGMSHEDNLTGMKELCDLIDSRRHGKDHKFRLYIFDEVDTTVSKLKEGTKFKDLIKDSLKEASHANIGVIYIGQSSDANEVPGMTNSNWGNAVQLHIGSNASLVINASKTLTAEDKELLLNQYRKINEYCERKNSELGLDIFTDATAYRFALCVPLSGLPKFMQLPDFDSYEYEDVMVVTTEASMQNLTVRPEAQPTATESACPQCGSQNLVKKGVTTTGKQSYQCKDCRKKFSL